MRLRFSAEPFTTPDDLGRKIAIALSSLALRRVRTRGPLAEKRSETLIVHPLLRASQRPIERTSLVDELTHWVTDPTPPDRLWTLVGARGTKKSAMAERVVRAANPGEANVLVWSFQIDADTDAFFRATGTF